MHSPQKSTLLSFLPCTLPVEIYLDMLPQPVNEGDYGKAAAFFKGDDWWRDKSVEKVMTPVGDASLEDRVAIHKALRNEYREYEGLWGYDRLVQGSKNGADFVKTGKAFADILGADPNTNHYQRQPDYDLVYSFVQDRLKDHPGELKAYMDLLKGGIHLGPAKRVFDLLPQPVKEGDFQSAAALFKGDNSWSMERVELVMKPAGKAPLADRIALLKSLDAHMFDSYYKRPDWDKISVSYASVLEKAKEGDDFSAIAGCYGEMLEAYGSKEFKDDYQSGLDFIARRLKDHPEEFKVFTELLKSGVTMGAAIRINEMLPEPVKDGDYEEAAASFKGDDWWQAGGVEAVMKAADDTTLKERVLILKALRSHHRAQKSVGHFEHMRELTRETHDFITLAGMFKKTLEALDGNPNQGEKYNMTLDFIASKLRGEPNAFPSFFRLVEAGKNVSRAMEAYDMIQAPVQGESYETRERAVLALMNSNFKAVYPIACRTIPPGETVEDSAMILGALIKQNDEISLEQCETILKGLIEKKGATPSSRLVNLIGEGIFSPDSPEALFNAVEVINRPVLDETFQEKEKVLLTIFNEDFGGKARRFNDALTIYDKLTHGLDRGESLEGAFDRLHMLRKTLASQKGMRSDKAYTTALDLFDFMNREKSVGAFGEATIDEVTAALIEQLMLSHTVEDAKNGLLHQFRARQESVVDKDEDPDFINIGGIKLKKGKEKT
jgi:hypothetical protein